MGEPERDFSQDVPISKSGGRQYIRELLSELGNVFPDDLRGRGKLPEEYELRYAPAQFRSIHAIAERFADSDWAGYSAELKKGVEEALTELLLIADAIASHSADSSYKASRQLSEAMGDRLKKIQAYFNDVVEPAVDAIENATGEPPATSLSEDEISEVRRIREELKESRAEFAELKAAQAAVATELEARKELVEAARTETGSSGAEDLSDAYLEQAVHHERQWKFWGIGLGVSVLAALVAGYVVLKTNQPSDDASTAQLVSHVAIDLLIVGILIYAVRVTSLQFSVHRHLAAVASNKAAALKTFARIISSGSSVETRDTLAEVLAYYVFVSDKTGFLDAAGDQVTLPERIAGPLAQRINGSA